jgi:hypothetical protein
MASYIEHLGLADFWDTLTAKEQSLLVEWNKSYKNERNIIANTTDNSSGIPSARAFLDTMAGWAVSKREYNFARSLLGYAEKSNGTIVELHFVYCHSVELYYKERSCPDALEKAKEYCMKDIELFPAYKAPLKKASGRIPPPSSFVQLAIIYEKEGNYKQAIDICQLAINYKLSDGTKGGYARRLARLRKKLD